LPGGATRVERFEHNGRVLVDEVLGESTTRHIVFLHGWGQSRESLRGLASLFQHTHTVHLLDLPGFGDAPPPPADWDTIHYTDLVQQFVLSRLSDWVILVGHSFGGRVGLRLAARRLWPIKGLVLIGVPGLPQPLLSRARARQTATRWLRKALVAARPLAGQRALDWHTRRFGSLDYLTAGALRPILVRAVNENLTESATSVACPTLLLWGSEDREAPPWLAYRYRRLMDGRASLEILPHKGHQPFAGTGGHLCAFKIRAWLHAHVPA
jgi:pimeloyl-ACP methyl ester carboxylesterase